MYYSVYESVNEPIHTPFTKFKYPRDKREYVAHEITYNKGNCLVLKLYANGFKLPL